jgi:membrane protease YdiL (CAAX protease family)
VAAPALDADSAPPRWGLGDAVTGTLASLVVPSLVAVIAFSIAGVTSNDADHLALWAVFLLQLPLWGVLVGVAVRAARTKGSGSVVRDFGLSMRASDVPIGIGAGLVAQFALNLVLIPIYDLFDINRDRVGNTARDLADRAHGAGNVVILVVMVVVIAPVVEELFYRGLWLRAGERRAGLVAGVVLSAVVFGAMHLQGVDTFALVGFGLVAGALAARAGRLGPAIWAHVAFNATAVVSLLHR